MIFKKFCEEMEFRDEYDYAGSDEEEALSFCDLVTERGQYEGPWDSNPGSSDQEDFDFDFDFGRSGSVAYYPCPADDLFHDGRLLPLAVQRSGSDSDNEFSYGKSSSCSENRRLLNEKLQAWRIDSLDSQSSFWTSSSGSTNSRRNFGDRSFRRGDPGSKSKATRTPPPCKSSLKWQFFTLGLMKTPPMKLEDMRLRQAKPNGAESSPLKRSVSCSFDGAPKHAKKELRDPDFKQKSKSVKENVVDEAASPRSRGWRMLAPLTVLNGCKTSTNSVIHCSTAKKRMDAGGLPELGTPAKKPPVYADQNSLNSAAKLSEKRRGSGLRGYSGGSKVDFPRLSFHSTILQVF